MIKFVIGMSRGGGEGGSLIEPTGPLRSSVEPGSECCYTIRDSLTPSQPVYSTEHQLHHDVTLSFFDWWFRSNNGADDEAKHSMLKLNQTRSPILRAETTCLIDNLCIN
ncbi:hypothetical protein KEM48_013916 [Puccinia striiformis f. sp. tritici PST-130]|nr:hypothetical protein KEM48_013916 [Puccinia striiformis f. sp. tritici PST-130]